MICSLLESAAFGILICRATWNRKNWKNASLEVMLTHFIKTCGLILLLVMV